MLTFSHDLPNDPRGPSLDLKRCPVGRAMTAIVTSVDLVGCPTHFYGGRTVPCTGDDCPAHKDGVPWRWHTYLSAYAVNAKVHFLFESTRRASESFIQYREAYGSLRGCQFRAWRATMTPNSRVYVETKPADLEQLQLPQPPNLLQVLSIIWNVPLTDMQIDHQRDNVDAVQVAPVENRVFPMKNQRLTGNHETVQRKHT